MDEGSTNTAERMDEDSGGGVERDSVSSSKKRFSVVYSYFTLNESTSRWECNYCE